MTMPWELLWNMWRLFNINWKHVLNNDWFMTGVIVIKLKDRIAKANVNIEYLIDELIGSKRNEYGNYCVDYSKQNEDKCSKIDCEECKEFHFEEIRKEMLKEYLV